MRIKKALNGNPLRAVAYIRGSRDEQKLTLEGQRQAIEAWAARAGVQVTSWHVDAGVCSVTPLDERTGFLGAIRALREDGAGLLVVARRDRLARDVVLAAMIERMVAKDGAKVVSSAGEGTDGDSPADVMMRTVIDAVAQYERAIIAVRTSAALQVKRSKGERVSARIPYGQAVGPDGVHLVPVEAEQTVIARARALRTQGLSFARVARALQAEGFLSRQGSVFADMQVSRMLA